jgi:hypothetical protein
LLIWDVSLNTVVFKGVAEGFDPSAIYSITCSAYGGDGKVYIGTNGYGLWIWDGTSFTNKGVSEGLSHSSVSSLAAGPNNKIYVGTLNGLSIWDGSSFTNYFPPFSYFESIVVDTNGIAYCTHGSSAFTKFNPTTNNQIVSWGDGYSYPRNAVICNGRIFATFNQDGVPYGGGVYEYIEGNYSLTKYTMSGFTSQYEIIIMNAAASNDKIYFLAQSDTGNPRFFVFDTSTSAFTEPAGNTSTGNASRAIGVASSGIVYFASDIGAFTYNGSTFSNDTRPEFQNYKGNLSLTIPLPPVTPTNVKLVGSKVVGNVTVDPTVNTVEYNGTSLPVGSVLRNTVTGIKYLKKTGGPKDYYAILTSPNPAWGWSGGTEAWSSLQNF